MEVFQEQVKKLLELIGLNDLSVDFDPEGRRVIVFANEGEYFNRQLPGFITDLEHLVRLLAKRAGTGVFYVDVNNYRKERERIIADLAKAAARKVLVLKQEVRLPAMNAYERRLIHVELSMHPQVTTESTGEGSSRCVVVKLLQ